MRVQMATLSDDEKKHEMELSTSDMHLVCQTCGSAENVEELKARLDMGLRNKALVLSGITCIGLLCAHVYACFHPPAVVTIPDIVWALIAAPWVGESAAKVAALLDKIMNRGGVK
jgi:hypothetical protein